MSIEPQMFTLHQVAEVLQLPYDVVRDAVYSGRWPHTKFTPRNRRMSQADIDQVVEMLHHAPLRQTRSQVQARSREISARLKYRDVGGGQ